MSVELIIATFENNEAQADVTLERVKALAKDKALVIRDVATIVKRKDGKVDVNDVGDVKSGRGAIFGAITGGLIGLVGGPIGAIAGAAAGAATGGATAKITDYGVSDKLIKEIKAGLQPGSSAIIAYVELNWVDKAINRLQENGATVYHETLEENISQEILKHARPTSG